MIWRSADTTAGIRLLVIDYLLRKSDSCQRAAVLELLTFDLRKLKKSKKGRRWIGVGGPHVLTALPISDIVLIVNAFMTIVIICSEM